MSTEDRGYLYHLGEKLIERRQPVLIAVTVVTLIFAVFASTPEYGDAFRRVVATEPSLHPGTQSVLANFGGANAITIMLEVKEGTIFTKENPDQDLRDDPALG